MRLKSILTLWLLAGQAWAQTPAPEPKDNIDIGGLLEAKKPCDEDKKKTEAAKPAEPAPQIDLGATPAEKKPQPAKKSLGAVPAPMENCK